MIKIVKKGNHLVFAITILFNSNHINVNDTFNVSETIIVLLINFF